MLTNVTKELAQSIEDKNFCTVFDIKAVFGTELGKYVTIEFGLHKLCIFVYDSKFDYVSGQLSSNVDQFLEDYKDLQIGELLSEQEKLQLEQQLLATTLSM